MPDYPQTERFRLADLTVDAATRQVSRGGGELPLPALSFDLLLALIKAGTRVVSTDELMERVWPGRVVNAETVAKRVELVREALGDDSQQPRYIALVRGRGYRLVQAPETAVAVSVAATPAASAPPVPQGRRHAWLLGAVAAVVLGAGTGWLVLSLRGEAPRPDSSRQATPSVAVLPFLNLSEDAGNAYFSDGISEELLGTLSKLPGVRVASRTSAFTFRDSNLPLPEIAKSLSVDHIVEGSVRKAGNRIRVTAQLIDVRSDSQRWAETYDRELADVFEIQREIAEKIAGALKLRFAEGALDRGGVGTRNVEAYQLFLRGHQVWQLRSEQNIRQGIGLLDRALELDPRFAQAHASLAQAHAMSFFWYRERDPAVTVLAERSAARAIELDPRLSQPHGVRGMLAQQHLDWPGADRNYRHAIELNPNDAQSAYWRAEMLVLAGRARESLDLMQSYEPLDPISPALLHDIAFVSWITGDLVKSCAYFRRVTQVGTSPYAWLGVADCEARAGNVAAMEAAERTAERLMEMPDRFFELVRRGRTDADAARRARAIMEVETARRRVYFSRQLWLLGETEAAIVDIEKAVLSLDTNPLRDLWWPDARDLRAHPRFRALVERLHLVEFWRASGWPDMCRPAGNSFECDAAGTPAGS